MWKCEDKPAQSAPIQVNNAEINKEKTSSNNDKNQKTTAVEIDKKLENVTLKNNVDQTLFPHIIVTHIGRICHSPIEYVKHVIQYRSESRMIQISGDKFNIFREYINLNRIFYIPDHVKLVGTITKTQNIFFPPNHVIHFNDTRFSTTGVISWTYKHDGTVFINPLSKSSVQDLSEYVDNVLSYMERTVTQLTLYNMEKNKYGDTVNVMYDGVSEPLEILEKRYINTLFHEQTNALWNMIKTINYYPEEYRKMGQAPQVNLLFHGPPGTGKSTFAYRVAMATKRHIINIKLSRYNRTELMKVFTKPQIKTTSYQPSDVIYVLDEFDKDIDRLILRQTGNQQQCDMVEKLITNTVNTWSSNKLSPIDEKCSSKTSTQEHNTPPSPVPSTSTTAPQNSVEKTEDSSQLRRNIKDIGTMIEEVTQAYDKVTNMGDDVLSLYDLLTIFQGSVPVEGTIILAMTNKYEYLCEKCPQLFRPGRLTPVHFGNFDRSMLNHVSQYYFNRQLHELPDTVNLQPSAVIDMVVKSMLGTHNPEQQYDQFLRYLKTLY